LFCHYLIVKLELPLQPGLTPHNKSWATKVAKGDIPSSELITSQQKSSP